MFIDPVELLYKIVLKQPSHCAIVDNEREIPCIKNPRIDFHYALNKMPTCCKCVKMVGFSGLKFLSTITVTRTFTPDFLLK